MSLAVYVIPGSADRSALSPFLSFLARVWTNAFMALFLRRVDHKRYWDPPRKDEPWLGAGDLRADALRDLSTKNNTLSIYEVTAVVTVERIIAALGANRDNLDKIDYIVFDQAILAALSIRLERVSGLTLDNGVNGCHVDMVDLTAQKLAEFGARIRVGGSVSRCLDKKLGELIQESVTRTFIDRSRLKPGLAGRLR